MRRCAVLICATSSTLKARNACASWRKFGKSSSTQGGALFGSLSAVENVRLPLDNSTELPDEAKDLIQALLKLRLVGLEAAATRLPAWT